MKSLKQYIIATTFATCSLTANAQVQFKIERMGESNNFMVSAVSNETYDNPKNLVSTAQVTLTMPTGDFVLDKVVNLYPDAKWRVNGRTNAPKENPSQDYLYFGLENLGTAALRFTKGKETPLFLIQAKTCNTALTLMDNQKDAFRFPNAARINVGNQMTILGAGGDAFSGAIADKKEATCIKSKSATIKRDELRIAPNVTSGGIIKAEFMLSEKDNLKGEMTIFDVMGRVVKAQNIEAQKGYNTVEIDVSGFPNATYYVMLSGIKPTPISERLVVAE
jgi:hypothetical protein